MIYTVKTLMACVFIRIFVQTTPCNIHLSSATIAIAELRFVKSVWILVARTAERS